MDDNSKLIRNIVIILAVVSFTVVASLLGLKYFEGKQKDEVIKSLQEENKNLNMKLIEISRDINEAGLKDKISALDWEPDEELQGILSMTEDNYMSLYDIFLQVKGEDVIKEHAQQIVDSVPYVGGYSLDRYPQEMESFLPTDDYGRYDLVFYVDVIEIEQLKKDSPQDYENVIQNLSDHGVVGY